MTVLMTHEHAGDYSKKHSPEEKVDTALASALQGLAEKGQIACADVFKVVSDLGVSPSEAGKTVDLLNIKLIKCQLGLYGYSPERIIVKPAESVSPELESMIRNNLVEERLPCAHAWKIAADLKIKKMDVSSAAEALNIKIKPCQLGAF